MGGTSTGDTVGSEGEPGEGWGGGQITRGRVCATAQMNNMNVNGMINTLAGLVETVKGKGGGNTPGGHEEAATDASGWEQQGQGNGGGDDDGVAMEEAGTWAAEANKGLVNTRRVDPRLRTSQSH